MIELLRLAFGQTRVRKECGGVLSGSRCFLRNMCIKCLSCNQNVLHIWGWRCHYSTRVHSNDITKHMLILIRWLCLLVLWWLLAVDLWFLSVYKTGRGTPFNLFSLPAYVFHILNFLCNFYFVSDSLIPSAFIFICAFLPSFWWFCLCFFNSTSTSFSRWHSLTLFFQLFPFISKHSQYRKLKHFLHRLVKWGWYKQHFFAN